MATLSSKMLPAGVATLAQGALADTSVQPNDSPAFDGLTVNGNAYPSDGALSNRNLIINGAMTVSQRGTSSSPAPVGYLIDRFATFSSGAGALSISQSSDGPTGFNRSALITVTTALTPTAGDYRIFQQSIEGNVSAFLAQGTAGAKTFTLSFWAKTSILGTFSGSFRDSTLSRSYVFEYTMNVINTWEYKTVTIAGSTSGTFNTDSGSGLILSFSQGQGTTFATATVGSWVAGNFHGSTTETDLIATLGATWQITGVQLEVGDTATPFEHRGFGQELALCQRYFQKITQTQTSEQVATGHLDSASNGYFQIPFLTEMRAAPTLGTSGSSTDYVIRSGGTTFVTGSVPVAQNVTAKIASLRLPSTGMTVGRAFTFQFSGTLTGAFLAFDAEL
tara:strand:+ start:1900 stop:3075 length:1176 start_codon:yes stop_codon:yes gene_type:complete